MGEPLQIADVWKRSLDATVQYYSTLGELAVECVESLLSTASNSIASVNPQSQPGSNADAGPSRSTSSAKSTPTSTMVLEAAVGKKALGVFLVENSLSRAVFVAATAGAFADDEGNEVTAALEFDPSSVTLQPAEQVLVKVSASIANSMAPGVRYRGEIGVPGLPGTRIPVVMGRTTEVKVRAKGSTAASRPRRLASRKRSSVSKRKQRQSRS